MTPEERQELMEAAKMIASVRNAMVDRRYYTDIRILERMVNEIANVLERDEDLKKKEAAK